MISAKPLGFNLALDDNSLKDGNFRRGYGRDFYDGGDDVSIAAQLADSDARLMEMLAAQAAHRENNSLETDEDDIAMDENLADDEKRNVLQKSLNMAASNGDVDRVRKLVNGKARSFVDINLPDEEGTVPLIYASCFVWPLFSFLYFGSFDRIFLFRFPLYLYRPFVSLKLFVLPIFLINIELICNA